MRYPAGLGLTVLGGATESLVFYGTTSWIVSEFSESKKNSWHSFMYGHALRPETSPPEERVGTVVMSTLSRLTRERQYSPFTQMSVGTSYYRAEMGSEYEECAEKQLPKEG